MFGKFFISNCLTACGILYLTYIVITYLSRKKYNDINHKIYRLSLIFIYLMVAIYFTMYYFLDSTYINILSKLFVVSSMIFSSLIGLYFITSFDIKKDENEKKNLKRLFIINGVVTSILCIMSCMFETKIIDDELYTTSGNGMIFLYVGAGYLAFIILRVFIKYKNLLTKAQKLSFGYIYFSFMILFLIKMITKFNFNYILYFCILLTTIIYFVFESQSYIMSKELENSRKELMDTTTKKNNFLYSVSSSIRKPISNIISTIDQINNENMNEEEYKQKLNYLNSEIVELSNYINKVDSMSFNMNEAGESKNA